MHRQLFTPDMTLDETISRINASKHEDMVLELDAINGRAEHTNQLVAAKERELKAANDALKSTKNAIKRHNGKNGKTFNQLHSQKEEQTATVNRLKKECKDLKNKQEQLLQLIQTLQLLKNQREAVLADAASVVMTVQAEDASSDLPEFTELDALIKAQRKDPSKSKDLIAAAENVANIYRHDADRDNAKNILIVTTNILKSNTEANREALIPHIEANTNGKYNKWQIVAGALITLLGAAMLAAGLALCVTGILLPLGPLLIAGSVAVLGIGIATLAFPSELTGKAAALDKLQSTAKNPFRLFSEPSHEPHEYIPYESNFMSSRSSDTMWPHFPSFH